jgi:hypothetical protein
MVLPLFPLVSHLPQLLAGADVQEVGDDLSVLQSGLLPDGFIARARLAEALEHEPGIDEQV